VVGLSVINLWISMVFNYWRFV